LKGIQYESLFSSKQKIGILPAYHVIVKSNLRSITMRNLTLIGATTLISLASLTGCNMSKQDIGMATGAAVGAIAAPMIFGNLAWYTIAGGAAAGGFIGSYVGKNMSSQNRQKVAYTLDKAPDKQPYQFMSTPQNSPDLTVTPLRSYKISNQQCRDFELLTQEGAKTVYDKGSACKQTDGSWKVRA
jgi:surface antigen